MCHVDVVSRNRAFLSVCGEQPIVLTRACLGVPVGPLWPTAMDGKESEKALRGKEELETLIRIYYMKKNLFSVEGKK